jgi:archaellum component FlaF (FlaF/FlaG flagellin family)
MDSVLPSVLGITVLLTSSLLLGRSGFASFRTMTDSWQQAEQQSMERLHSDITITSVNRTGGEVDVTVQNTGATSVVDFSKVDVVVQYSSGGTSYVKYIAFTTDSPPPDDMWGVVAIVNDVVDPRVLNSGESMTLRVQLNPAPDTASNWLQVTTEQGFSASSVFN